MAYIYFNDEYGITVEETYEDVSIEIYEALKDNYPFIRLTMKDMEFNPKLTKMESIEREIQININQIVWFR
jgi:hypothetical protein